MANLSASDLLQFITWALYVLVFVVTAYRFVRHHRRVDLDATLLFGTTALMIVVTVLANDLPASIHSLIPLITSSLLMSLPCLFLRLVDDFAGIPTIVTRIAEAGLALAVVGIVVLSQPYAPWFVVALVLYFVSLETYAALIVFRLSQQTSGITRRRTQSVALGTVFLGLVLVLAGIQATLPRVLSIDPIVVELCAVASGLCYFTGFTPPAWLRRAWQTPELRTAIQQSAAAIRLTDQTTAVESFTDTATVTLGASYVAIWLWNDSTGTLQRERKRSTPAATSADVHLRVFQHQRAALVETPPDLVLSSDRTANHGAAVLVAPISLAKRRFGVLVVSSIRAPIFGDDDLELVQVLADQAAVVLQNRELVEAAARERARAEALAILEQDRRRLNAELEARVLELTAALQRALDDLESFSYSVSHDLRAPLRTIDGFCQTLVEDSFDQLAPDGQDALRRIRAASQRMSEIIDGLLRLSRVTRSELRPQLLSLSDVARGVIAELQHLEPSRDVVIDIEDDVVAMADLPLIRVVLENLLGNAWKFTSRTAAPKIDFGVTRRGDEVAYVVRDNGAGFDMAYANKLFVPFQRLHRRDEYDGTGIGLATVQRIVERHGGRIWAEAELDRGASIYFTLDGQSQNDAGVISRGGLIARAI
jgi:signal transduction histidine kinase